VALRSGSATVRASGLLAARPEDSALSLAVEGDLQDVEPWLLEMTGWSLGARGALRARARVTGTARRPIIDADLAIDAGTLAITGMPALATSTFRDDALHISEFKACGGAAIAARRTRAGPLFDRWPTSYVENRIGDRTTSRQPPLGAERCSPVAAAGRR
jgi:hypothetical protein